MDLGVLRRPDPQGPGIWKDVRDEVAVGRDTVALQVVQVGKGACGADCGHPSVQEEDHTVACVVVACREDHKAEGGPDTLVEKACFDDRLCTYSSADR